MRNLVVALVSINQSHQQHPFQKLLVRLQVVSVQTEGGTRVTTYRECRRRAQLFALALSRLGVKLGDRVATLAWNNSRHLETW